MKPTSPKMLPWRWILWPLAVCFGGLVRLRHLLFNRGILKIAKLEKPVISIGNIAMGGTGKSPLTMALIEYYLQRGKKVGVLSRGYGRRNPKQSLRVTGETSYRDGGDEPVMMARRYPEALIAVGPSREAAAAILGKQPDVFLIDDGFQHRQLHRQLDLVLLDMTQGAPQVFPLGMFREGWRGLQRADAVFLTRWQPGVATEPWLEKIGLVAPNTPVLACGFQPMMLHEVSGKPVKKAAALKGMRIAAYAGIGKPQVFFESLRNLGADLVLTKVLPDHGGMSISEAEDWFKTVAGLEVEAVITTEKDAVKLDNPGRFGIVILFLSTGVIWQEPAALKQILEEALPL